MVDLVSSHHIYIYYSGVTVGSTMNETLQKDLTAAYLHTCGYTLFTLTLEFNCAAIITKVLHDSFHPPQAD